MSEFEFKQLKVGIELIGEAQSDTMEVLWQKLNRGDRVIWDYSGKNEITDEERRKLLALLRQKREALFPSPDVQSAPATERAAR